MVAESKSQASARDLVAPLKELFGAIFFVSMGALMNIDLLPSYLGPLAVLLAVAFATKLGLTYVAARSQGVPRGAALRTALGLAGPGGEVSLTVVKGGADVGVLSPFVLPMVGAMTIVTAILSPYRVRLAWRDRKSSPVGTENSLSARADEPP
jgi:CPA2 family monovalent cation:H+ antiporter-2